MHFVGALKAKHWFYNYAVLNPSGQKLLLLSDVNDSEISAPQCATHYSTAGNDDVLGNVLHQNIRLSHVTVSDILDSDHLPTVFHILDHVTTKKPPETLEKFTDCKRFHN
jgi:hypothetical protein